MSRQSYITAAGPAAWNAVRCGPWEAAMLVVEAYPMRTLYVRRHTMRRKPGQHVSQDGIDLARLVGAESGPFNLVVTSPVPRAVETAIAMGFEVDETDESLGRIPSGPPPAGRVRSPASPK